MILSVLKANYFQKKVSANKIIVLSAVYFTLVFNLPFLVGFGQAITSLAQYNLLFLASVPILLCALIMTLFTLFSVKYVFKPLLIATTLTSSLVFYAAINYGIVFDYGMIENTAETNPNEMLSYINAELTCYFIATGLFPSIIIYLTKINFQPIHKELFNRAKLITASLSVIFIIAYFFYQNYAAVGRNNQKLKKILIPSQYLSSTYNYLNRHYFYKQEAFKIVDSHPRLIANNTKKQVVVMVVGETARAKSFSHNGYPKATNQFTAPAKLISFKKMFSCGTATAVSVPCMFSALSRDNFERRDADNQQNLLDIAKLAGVDVLWVDNNGCKNVCLRVPTITIDVTQDSPLCDGQYCLDEALLKPLQEKLAHLSAPTTLIVLHMMGSHGPTYFKRYPDEKAIFTPDCPRSDIQNCTSESLINTYDNTIAYTDFVLADVIKQLGALPKNIESSMVYVSDHGESLGESGAFLHGFPYALSPKEQRHIPLLAWLPQKFQRECLNKNAANKHVNHDYIFHSIIGLLNISSSAYKTDLDIFSPCKLSNEPHTLLAQPEGK